MNNLQEQIEKLQSQLIQGNWLLLQALEKLNSEDKAFFAGKVEKFIASCRNDFNDSANGKIEEPETDEEMALSILTKTDTDTGIAIGDN